jgi:RNA-binding protein 39
MSFQCIWLIFSFELCRSDRKDKDGNEKESRDKDRKRSSSRDKERRRRSRSGDRDRHRSDKDRGDRGDRGERSDRHRSDRGGRDRERSRSRGRKEPERDREKERADREKERNERDKERAEREAAREVERAERQSTYASAQEGDRPDRPSDAEVQAERAKERDEARIKREIDDLTKDQRTVFVSQLTAKVNEAMIRSFFDQLGKVNNIIMIRDKNSGKHKGFAYVEMGDLEAIPNCLLFNNVVPDFQKFPILVKASEAEKNFNAKKETTAVKNDPRERTGVMGGNPDCRLYMGNINVNINEIALKSVLEQFGSTENVNLHRDEMGNSKGFAFIRFSQPESAALALASLAGVELAGRVLKVGRVIDQLNPTGAVGGTSALGGSTDASAHWKLDDDDGGRGQTLTSANRAALMAKLGQAAGIQMPVPAPLEFPQMNSYGLQQPLPIAPGMPVIPPLAGVPSTCFMIRNMFDPLGEGDGEWDTEIREDVSEECSKFGVVEHCYVERNKPGGLVFLKFSAMDPSYQAANSLNGRFFAGRMITVTFLDPALYYAIIQN